MVGKRRPHKTKPPYKRVVGTGVQPDNVAAEVTPQLVAQMSLDANNGSSTGSKSLPESTEEDEEAAEANGETNGKALDFPLEIIDLICKYCSKKFHLLFINSRWFLMALSHVYAEPRLTAVNFPLFVTALTNDRELGSSVRSLELSRISQVGRNSMVSRLLRRCSPKLEIFVAPQSHFGYAPMISLAACERLKYLDLSLVSETLDLPQLFATIQRFQELEVLYFPRSSIKCEENAVISWPPNLRQLGLSGGFPARFLEQTEFSPSLTTLRISNCPYLTTQSLNKLLDKVGSQLEHLSLTYPVPQLSATAIDFVLRQCPNLKTLQVSVDYISSAALDTDLIPPKHPLQHLSILTSGLMGHSDKIKPSHVLMATDELVNLRRVSVSLLLGWKPESSSLNGLVETLNERGGGVWVL